MAIADDWTIDYTDKTVTHSSGTTVYSVNALYSYLQDIFDESGTMDDTIPMSAQTPTEYTLINEWFIDETSIQYLNGGAIETSGWNRVVDTTAGIVQVTYTGTPSPAFDSGDIGAAIVHDTDNDAGTLLAYDTTRKRLWIRPDSSAAANNFDSVSGNLDVTGGPQNLAQSGAADSGENLWANIYTLGSLRTNTDIYVYQDDSKLTSWWSSGHIDVLILVKEAGTEIDYANIAVFARQYSSLYDHFEIDLTAGGRNAVPLATSDDLNNESGYRQMALTTAAGGPFVAGEVITDDSDSDIKGVVTSVSGTNPNVTLQYYLIGNPLTDFSGSTGGFTGGTSSATATAVAPTNVGPTTSPSTTVTIGMAGVARDLNNGYGSAPYSVEIDLQSSVGVDELYERLKYLTRRGSTGDIETQTSQTLVGEEYRAIGDYYIPYDTGSIDNPFTEGETITGPGSFSCTLSTKHDQGTSEGFIIVRDSSGTIPSDGDTLTGGTSSHTAVVDEDSGNDPVAAITPSKTAPFGTFAGGKFFGARGVWLANVMGDDATNYELVDSEGVQQVPPITYPVTVTVQDASGTAVEDAQVFIRKSGDYYSYSSDTGNSAGDADFVVNEVVDTELPQTGWLHVWDASTNTKQNYRYASWTSKTFTLRSEVTGSATSNGTSTSLISTSTNFLTADIEEGDAIRNTTDGAWAVVDEIVDANNITTSELSGSAVWDSSDAFSIHRLAVTYADNDDLVDIPLFNGQTNASGVISTTFDGTVPEAITVRIRSNEDSTKYVPYNTSGSITTSGYSLTAVLTEDTVAT